MGHQCLILHLVFAKDKKKFDDTELPFLYIEKSTKYW